MRENSANFSCQLKGQLGQKNRTGTKLVQGQFFYFSYLSYVTIVQLSSNRAYFITSMQSYFQSSSCCSYCALTNCLVCIENGKPCHAPERGKAVCSMHSRNNRQVSLEMNRLVLVPLNSTENFDKLTSFVLNTIFKTFYSEYHVFFFALFCS